MFGLEKTKGWDEVMAHIITDLMLPKRLLEKFRTIFSANNMPTFTEELLLEISPTLKSGAIEVDYDHKKYSKLIADRFPFTGSKIAWSRVPHSVQEIQSPQDPISQCLRFMEQQLMRNAISDDVAVAVIGDSAVECVFLTTVGSFREVAPSFLELPQHLYIIPSDAAWCMVFTMEGDMCFGNALPTPDSSPSTPRD